MREQLLGYLLDALDDDERMEVERRIDADPRWREELRALQDALEPLAEAGEPHEPPEDLAERTCAAVHEFRSAERAAPARGRFFAGMTDSQATHSHWSVADTIVTAGILLVATMLFFPAIANSRYSARLAHCQNNLRQLGMALASYSDKAGAGYFPWVPSAGRRAFAGIYAPMLLDSGYLTEPECLFCPAAPQRRSGPPSELPTLVEVDQASPEQLAQLRSQLADIYAFNLGVMVDGVHQPARNQGRTRFAMMADTPDTPGTTRLREPAGNHRRELRSVLFEDGHVDSLRVEVIDAAGLDHPFVNHYGYPEAGVDEDDAVVAPGPNPPFIRGEKLQVLVH